MQARDLMTRDVVTVPPGATARQAAELMARNGWAALPVVDATGAVVGIVAEADVLRSRLPQDPRLHMVREPEHAAPPMQVQGVMTSPVVTVPATADVADVARLFVDRQLRSAPVVDGERLVGILSRRDLLRTLVRLDEDVAADVLRLVEAYTGELEGWWVTATDGVVAVGRTDRSRPPAGDGTGDPAVLTRALATLARTVPGVVAVSVDLGSADPGPG
ncbi:CBS domain-containing protein [Modestobacter roseus]|uniref:CBS domain protein n=1 Tax=Modestobacter roseus TaxID=1181884 RepID=A0A562IQW1_9ACTN|nr:CBS domain-containing protein [Modestobacter roseus]MQA34643.1 CBS domain-containing protein [Modestobacter roseus]TWH73115.1 CBS domain protein [Modestobacter roseus]